MVKRRVYFERTGFARGRASALMLAIAICNGCSTYQRVPLEDIQATPEKFINKKARVHLAASTLLLPSHTFNSHQLSGRFTVSRSESLSRASGFYLRPQPKGVSQR